MPTNCTHWRVCTGWVERYVAARFRRFPVRDSKDPHGPALTFATDAFTAFVRDVQRGNIAT
ncbi:DUF397 domain-containing protein [Streptomyces sp. NPDC020096]